MDSEKYMKPAQYVEHQLLKSILHGEFSPGMDLPGERTLAEKLGVTRPTLRETLQKMAREGWLLIRHGKPTRVKDYMLDGGMGVMATLARYGDELPKEFLVHFLSLRSVLIPSVARMTMHNNPKALEEYLKTYPLIENSSRGFTSYDWELQLLMASQSGNLFFRTILNDFDSMYRTMATDYFEFEEARNLSRNYYRDLLGYVIDNDADKVFACVENVMSMALDLWKTTV